MCEAAANTSPSSLVLISQFSFALKERKHQKSSLQRVQRLLPPSEGAGLAASFFELSGRPKGSQRPCGQSHKRLRSDESTASADGAVGCNQGLQTQAQTRGWQQREEQALKIMREDRNHQEQCLLEAAFSSWLRTWQSILTTILPNLLNHLQL